MEKDQSSDVKQNRKRFILTFLVMLFVAGAGWAQSKTQVSFTMKGVSLKEVFDEITRQTGYNFAYSSDIIQKAGRIDLLAKDEDFRKLLDRSLAGTGLGYRIEDNYIVISPNFANPEGTACQVRLIRGKVYDKQGNTLPGVTVRVKGTTIGVTSDEKGAFQLLVTEEPDILLVFSFVGMRTQEVRAGEDSKPLKIVLEEEVQTMEEVVVNGLFTQNRNSYTGSVTTLSGEDILSVSQTNLLQAITMLTPGMRIVENNEQGANPNHIPEIIIRGMTSVASEGEEGLNRPLIILDGVEITLEQLYDLDMFDIERIDVLKDASATSIYGEKAANGVIVVERKRVTDSKLRVRYNFVPNVNFPDVSSFHLCNAAQKLEIEKRYGLYDSPVGKYDEEYNEKLKRVNAGVNTDWSSKPLRNSWSFDHSLNLSGRGGGLDYSISLHYGDTRGVMKGDFRQNYSIGFYFSYFYKNRLTISYRSDFTKTDSKLSPYGEFSDFSIINPYDTPKNEFGEWNKMLSYDLRNPLYDATTNSFSKSKGKVFTNTLNARLDIIKGIYVTGSFSYILRDARSDVFDSPESSTWLGITDAAQKGQYSIFGQDDNNWSAQYALNFSRSFGPNGGTLISMHLGGTASKNKSDSWYFSGVGFLKASLDDLHFATRYPDGRPDGEQKLNTSVGFYANLNVFLKSKYFLDASYRKSGSSNYGTSNLYAPYWSVGLGWNVHNESFMEHMPVSLLRIKGSVGYTGSGNFGGVRPVTIYTYNVKNNYYEGVGTTPTSMGNDELKSQRTLSYNGGLALELWEGRLGVNFDIYRQESKDLLLAVSLPPSAGITSVKDNLGESVNRGYEWSVSAQILKKKDLFWRLTLSGTHTENRLVKISNALKRQNDANKDSLNYVRPKIQLEEGEASDAIYAVRSLGIDPATGKEIFIKKDGSYTFTYDPDDKVALGSETPIIQGSLTTVIGWKGFTLNAALSYTFGGYIYNATRAAKIENINPRQNVDRRVFTERWKEAGDVVHYIKLEHSGVYAHSERFVEKKNEVYLSSLGLAYDLKSEWVRRIGLTKLRLGITLTDVARISTVKYERGTSYPYMRGFNFTISPTF